MSVESNYQERRKLLVEKIRLAQPSLDKIGIDGEKILVACESIQKVFGEQKLNPLEITFALMFLEQSWFSAVEDHSKQQVAKQGN